MFSIILAGITLQNVGIICFAGCYFIAAGLEFQRLRRPQVTLYTAELVALCAGLFAHTAFLYYRTKSYDRLPLSSQQDWILVIAWVFAWLALYLLTTYKEKNLGAILLPGILVMLAWGKWLANAAVYAYQPASDAWCAVHVLAMMLTTVAVLLGFLSGVLYLMQARHLKHPQWWKFTRRLPSLEWLHRANCHAMKFSVFFLALGILSGLVLNEMAVAQGAPKVAFRDPFILGATLLLAWYLASYAVSFFWKFSREGHLVAYRTILSFVALLTILTLGSFEEHRRSPLPSGPGDVPEKNAPDKINATDEINIQDEINAPAGIPETPERGGTP